MRCSCHTACAREHLSCSANRILSLKQCEALPLLIREGLSCLPVHLPNFDWNYDLGTLATQLANAAKADDQPVGIPAPEFSPRSRRSGFARHGRLSSLSSVHLPSSSLSHLFSSRQNGTAFLQRLVARGVGQRRATRAKGRSEGQGTDSSRRTGRMERRSTNAVATLFSSPVTPV